MKGSLYLIPNTLGGNNIESVIPPYVTSVVKQLDHFIVENIRSCRRYIIRLGYEKPIDDIKFYEIGKHTKIKDTKGYLAPCSSGRDMGMISEAGVPGVADPGAYITAMAHERGIKVIPLTGPSSILLALMASGLNGQNFSFHGYLPINNPERSKKIANLEMMASKFRQTQIFMETPFRNNKLFSDILATCQDNTMLCVACDLTLETEFIHTKRVQHWKKERTDLNKRPCIFLIGPG